jgi:4-hydroxythreonine-4-phosphate dehydrogenase
MTPFIPRIGITAGDPNGIGPEIALRTALHPEVRAKGHPVLIGAPKQFEDVAKRFNLALDEIEILEDGIPFVPPVFGQVSAQAGASALAAIDAALKGLSSKTLDAMVTAPICKEAVVKAGNSGFAGHTGYIAEHGGNPVHALALFANDKAISFVSLHESIRQALETVEKDRIVQVATLLHELFIALGLKRPRIAVSGLNPHAGEGGLFGEEEMNEIIPAIQTLRENGLNADGPLPPDVIYPALFGDRYDAVVSMIHDHGHVAFKTAHFNFAQSGGSTGGVNVTLGLPFIRTSADHGTAFDIAGKGIGDPGSMIDAFHLATRLVLGNYGSTDLGKD